MAGTYEGPGHRIVSGEIPIIGLRVWTNEYKQGTIVKVDSPTDFVGKEKKCGYYCESWHEIEYVDGRRVSMNCDRLTTKKPF